MLSVRRGPRVPNMVLTQNILETFIKSPRMLKRFPEPFELILCFGNASRRNEHRLRIEAIEENRALVLRRLGRRRGWLPWFPGRILRLPRRPF